MKKFWAFYLLLPVCLLLVSFGGRTAAAPGLEAAQTPVIFESTGNAPDPNETLRLVNEERTLQGLPALEANEQLGLVAQARAADMAARQYYAHKDPDGKYYFDYFQQFGIDAGYSCENLDIVFVPSQEMVIEEWMASLKGHRGCMLNTQTTKAGYATTKISLIQFDGTETQAYLVVAIHASLR